MSKSEFLKLMGYPIEWLEWDMYPDDLFSKQLELYRAGDEQGSEHDRNGAFHWWLKRKLSLSQWKSLVLLTFKDPDPVMAADVRKHIQHRSDLPSEVRVLLHPTAEPS